MDVKKPKTEETEIRKILVKCPDGSESSFMTFPFLITLSEEFPKAEINVICEEGCSEALGFLPFKLRFFERPRDKKSLFMTHQFCANLHDVFNIDLFFDLENTFNSAFMGFNFRSVERVGFEKGPNKYFLTKRYLPNVALDIESSSIKLLEQYKEKSYQDVRISRAMEEGTQVAPIEQLFKEVEPPKFIMVMLDNFQNVSRQINMWTQFFDCFQEQKFIIASQHDEHLISELFAGIDLGHNSLFMHKGGNTKEMIYLLNKVMGVVTNNAWAEGLCTYYGTSSLTFVHDQVPLVTLPRYHYFRMRPERLYFNSAGPMKLSLAAEDKELEMMNQVVDHLHILFKL